MDANKTLPAGSLTELPHGLIEVAKELEEQLTVPASKLKEIVDHFISELDKGESTPFTLLSSNQTLYC